MTQASDLNLAHKHSIRHRAEIETSDVCDCFYCLGTLHPSAITDWTDWPEGTPEGLEDLHGQTALCSQCGIDAVPSSASGFPITPAFLKQMNVRWFQAFS